MADAVEGIEPDASVDGHGHDAKSHALHEQMPYLQHHWDTPAQQFDAGKLGMWLFLATEVLFFAGLFCAYSVLRRSHPQVFIVGQHFLDVFYGGLNTIVLILSSFTMALGVWCAQTSRKNGLIVCLILTLAGAVTFMVVKYIEYDHKLRHGIVWGQNFNPVDPHHGGGHDGHEAGAAHESTTERAAPAEVHTATPASAPYDAAAAPSAHAPSETSPAPPGAAAPHTAATTPAGATQPTTTSAPALPTVEVSQIGLAPAGTGGLTAAALESPAAGEHEHVDAYEVAKTSRDLHLFMSCYFALTGLHGIHVLAGIFVISLVLRQAIKGRYNSNYYTPVDLVGLYWHVVDLVWIFLFPLLYLIH